MQKDDRHILLADIQRALGKAQGEPYPDDLFKELFYWWGRYTVRKGIHYQSYITAKWKEGWLNSQDARAFCEFSRYKWHPNLAFSY